MSKPSLSVCMAVYDDLDGLYFTVQAINLFHPEVRDRIEILVLDNNPESEHGRAVEDFLKNIKNARYFPYDGWQSTAVRDVLFDEAESDYVLCVDSHVLILPGVLARLIDYYSQNVHSGDLLQGPMLFDDYDLPPATHFDHIWQKMMLGVWGFDERGSDPNYPPFEIQMQGLGLFSCRKDAWLGFNRLFRGFGGEEWYIHEKFRRAGKKTLCLPFMRWTHRFRRPDGAGYALNLDDRVYNYFVGHMELDADVAPVYEHFEAMGSVRLDQLCELARRDLLLAPLRLRNSAPEIPIVTCLMMVNNVSQMHLNEAVESFHRQYYQARELVIFNDGPNILECDHPLVRIINYPDGLSSLDERVRMALPACNGDIICLWDSHGIELPWRISVDVEMVDSGFEFWRPANFWRGEADGMTLRLSNYEEFAVSNCAFRRGWLVDNSLNDTVPVEHLELTRVSTIARDAQYVGHSDPIAIETGWRLGYDSLASDASVRALNAEDHNKPLPTFLAVCDIVLWAELAIENLIRIGGLEIILVDNASTNPRMIEFLNNIEYEVIKLEKRVNQSEVWSTGICRSVDGLFLAVHSFFDLSDLPVGTPGALNGVLDTIGVSRCGVSVVFDDLPEHNPCGTDIADKEKKNWGKKDGDCYNAVAGFAFTIGRSDQLSARFDHLHTPQRRLCPPYVVRYLPWYLNLEDIDSIPEDALYYLEHATGVLFEQYMEAAGGIS